jgi:hypothetical protein
MEHLIADATAADDVAAAPLTASWDVPNVDLASWRSSEQQAGTCLLSVLLLLLLLLPLLLLLLLFVSAGTQPNTKMRFAAMQLCLWRANNSADNGSRWREPAVPRYLCRTAQSSSRIRANPS